VSGRGGLDPSQSHGKSRAQRGAEARDNHEQ
jgi:hypothetical protein